MPLGLYVNFDAEGLRGLVLEASPESREVPPSAGVVGRPQMGCGRPGVQDRGLEQGVERQREPEVPHEQLPDSPRQVAVDDVDVGGAGVPFVVLGDECDESPLDEYVAPSPELAVAVPDAEDLRPARGLTPRYVHQHEEHAAEVDDMIYPPLDFSGVEPRTHLAAGRHLYKLALQPRV